MIGIKIDIRGIDPLKAKFGKASNVVREEMTKGIGRALAWGQSYMSKYPTKNSSFSMGGFVSDRQRRFFFWALREGVISVPYRRTGTLGKSWNTDIRQVSSNITGVLENTRDTYNELVHLAGSQARVHKGVWQVIEELSRSPQVEKIQSFFAEVAENIAKRLG